MQLPDAAVGSILAAAIAGLVVFISTVLTKEQKTSEFRQVWIDEIRKDIAQFISGASEIVALNSVKKSDMESQLKFIEDNFKLIHELQSIEHRIILRLNPKEHSDLIGKIQNFRKEMILAYSGTERIKLEQKITSDLLDATKAVLKYEWERVKRGEPTFRIVKWGALFIISILVFLFFRSPIDFFGDKKIEEEKSGLTQNISNESWQVNISNPDRRLPSRRGSEKTAQRGENDLKSNPLVIDKEKCQP